jgi:hypothetical protein
LQVHWIGYILHRNCPLKHFIGERYKGREDDKEDVSSNCMTLKEREDIGTLIRKHYIELCGELALEEAINLWQGCITAK